MESKTTGKRIVSKRDYVRLVCQRVILTSFGLCLHAMAFISGLAAIYLLLCAIISITVFSGEERDAMDTGICLMVLVISPGAAYLCNKWGKVSIQQASKIDMETIIYTNTADLPAPESLVRASEQPSQEQEAVLLRSLMEAHQTPSEQLVRAVEDQNSGSVKRL